MTRVPRPIALFLTASAAVVLLASVQAQPPQTAPLPPQPQGQPKSGGDDQSFRFKSGVELINVTATVSDPSGRFVSGLQQDDFVVYEDDKPVNVTHFSAERVPVSLGIALDTSGSMAGHKIQAAQDALDRFLYELLDKNDEIFLYRFSNVPMLLQGWTRDRQLLSRALGRITPNGGTAMYDAVADAVPLAQQGQNRKKALLVISDGNDTASGTNIREVKARIRDRLQQLSSRLGDAEWLDGAFSAGDLMMVAVLLRLKPSGLLDVFPSLAAYAARGTARPAYQRAFAAQLAVNAAVLSR